MGQEAILYLGDTSLASGASYLAGLMTLRRLGYEYLPSDVAVNGEAERPRRLYILSDYPSHQLGNAKQRQIMEHVRNGAGLLMIGGWESFHGLGGDWDRTALAEILPVNIDSADDRINCDQPALVRCAQNHPIVDGLPWNERPPTIGGFNRITAKTNAATILEVQRHKVRRVNDGFDFEPAERDPLLVVGQHGKGRTVALATDLAPHWVGGLVDWGTGRRVVAEAPGSSAIEVGDLYTQFIFNLLAWTGQLSGTK